MDDNTKKVLKFFNKNPEKQYSLDELVNYFSKIPVDDLIEITGYLIKNNFIKSTIDGFESTNKGKNYFKVNESAWISEHIIETIALVFSILAFIEATVALLQ